MKQQRVTTDEVLDMHDLVAKMWKRAHDLGQCSVYERLSPVMSTLCEIAKSTALDEAWDRRRLPAPPHTSSNTSTPTNGETGT